MKVIAVTEKEYQKDGQTKKLWRVVLEKLDGPDIEAVAFEPVRKGDDIPDDKITPDGRGGYTIKSANGKGKGSYPRNEELYVAQDAMKSVIQLYLGGFIQPPMTAEGLFDNCLTIAEQIVAVSKKLKGSAPATPATPAKQRVITGSKELFRRISDELFLTATECQAIKGFVEAVNHDDFDRAWELARSSR